MARPMPAAICAPRGLRLRPGERPAWWHASADREHFGAWRSTAAAHRLSVDVLVSLLLEFDLVAGDLRDVGADPIALVSSLLAREDHVRRLGPAGSLRDWLASASMPEGIDELPELVLPERLVARLAPGTGLAPRLSLDHVELAVACDRCAAARGRTLESWALRAALLECSGARRSGQAFG